MKVGDRVRRKYDQTGEYVTGVVENVSRDEKYVYVRWPQRWVPSGKHPNQGRWTKASTRVRVEGVEKVED